MNPIYYKKLLQRISPISLAICLSATSLLNARVVAQTTSSAGVWDNARVTSLDASKGTLILVNCPPEEQQMLAPDQCKETLVMTALSTDVRSQLAFLHPGDHVTARFANDKRSVIALSLRTKQIRPFARFLAIAIAYTLFFLVVTIFTRGHPFYLITGTDQRYSNSKSQMALWFSVLISTYLALVVLRVWAFGWGFWGNIEMPAHLFALSGASAFTYGAAKGITTSKVQAAKAAGQEDPKPVGTPAFLLDLVSNDKGNFDFGDFQMIVLTLIAVAMYLMSVFLSFGDLESLRLARLPDVDTTILAAFGLGQGAYLAKKAGGAPATS